jgi:hypothetical protein
MANGFAR